MKSPGSPPAVPAMAAVLDAIRDRVTVSRVELVGATGLTAATITNTVRRLMSVGYVREVGTLQSGAGSPRRLIRLEPDACYTVGIQFDRFTSTAVIVDLAGDVVERSTMPGAALRHPDSVVASLGHHIEELLSSAAVPRSKVLGVGVTTHGPQDRDAGVLLTSNPSIDWLGYPLAASLSDLIDLPVLIENDATAAAVGEEGLGSSGSSFATVYMSGGIGSGVVLNGQPYRGASSNGVELGHISVDAFGPRCTCGNTGCIENLAGPTVIVEKARNTGLRSRLRLGQGTLVDFKAIGRAAMAGDPDARALIEGSAAVLAVGVATLVNLFDVARVVFTGDAFTDVGPIYRRHAQDAVDKGAFMRAVHPVRVEQSRQMSDAAAIGGAVLVLRSLLGAGESAMRTARGAERLSLPAAVP
ncbi:ROK family protein [Humibacter sp.]|uniref:ROK family protein n=1 Tax=Humibacter sp. TaxID=1940291 RepID=UPI002D7FE9F0|nr:ROK family protein [Humibacter sp.]